MPLLRGILSPFGCCKLERIQRQFLSVCHHRFFSHPDYSYSNVLKYLKLHAVSARRRQLDVLSLTDVYRASEYCPTHFEAVGLRVTNQNFRDFSLFDFALNFGTVLPLDTLRQQMPSTVILPYSIFFFFWGGGGTITCTKCTVLTSK
jgi:hypothetical protein